ncbi:hypothetical protein [Acidocella sp.]|uniref:hypothetical protein n=1 Tax=Acidocella sp. TaxID=50710 RepID=UPI002605E027|nr:hypothetical protein [Acidocella sp.]
MSAANGAKPSGARRFPVARAGFLACAFLIPGLIGTFATYSIPLPAIDEAAQASALEGLLSAPTPAALQARLTALPAKLDPDTYALIATSTQPLPARVAAAKANMRREVIAEARASAYRVRLMVITMTILGALFGIALLGPEKP